MSRPRNRSVPNPERLRDEYLEFVKRDMGLRPSTLRQQRKAVQDYLDFVSESALDLTEVAVDHLDTYLERIAARGFSRSYLAAKQVGLKGFLRFLHVERYLSRDLAQFVSAPRRYRESTVPQHYEWAEVQQLLASITGTDHNALRDRAMLYLLSVYGLRSQELANLQLDDVDWVHEKILIRERKMNDTLVLPLVPLVAAVLHQYVQNGRSVPPDQRALILTNRRNPIPNGLWVSSRLLALAARAGLRGGRGCHALRRAVGTRLVELGSGAGEVAQILGHTSLTSTRVYLRLSISLLRDVADNYGELF